MSIVDYPHVHAGDLITSDLVNYVLDSIDRLDDRIAKLEAVAPPVSSGTGRPVLISRTPDTTLNVGDLLVLKGQNFAPLAGVHIHIGEQDLDQSSLLLGSNDTTLRFGVPTLAGLPKRVLITVSTPEGRSENALEAEVRIPVKTASGKIYLDDQNTAAVTPEEKKPLQYEWHLRSEVDEELKYKLTFAYTGVDPASLSGMWSDATSLDDYEIVVAPGAFEPVTLRVSKVPEGAKSANLTITATSEDGTIKTSSNSIRIKVGSPSPISNTKIQLILPLAQPPFDVNGDDNPITQDVVTGPETVVFVPPGVQGFVQLTVAFLDQSPADPLKYRFFADIEDAGTIWTTGDARPGSVLRSGPGGIETVNFAINNGAAASDASPHDAYMLAKAAKLKTDGTDEYVSFGRFVVRNNHA